MHTLERRVELRSVIQLVPVNRHQLHQVGGQHGGCIHHSEAASLCIQHGPIQDPIGGHPEHGVGRGHPVELSTRSARIERQVRTRLQAPLPDVLASEEHPVGPVGEVQVVAKVDRRHDEPRIPRELRTDLLDPLEQLATLPLVDQVHQVHRHLHGQRLDGQQVLGTGLGGARRLGLGATPGLGVGVAQLPRQSPTPAAASRNGMRSPGTIARPANRAAPTPSTRGFSSNWLEIWVCRSRELWSSTRVVSRPAAVLTTRAGT